LKRVYLALQDISGPSTVTLHRQQEMETIVNTTHLVKETPSQLIAPLS